MAKRILIVDDDPLICEMLGDRLHAIGYEVLTANDGYSALALIALEAMRSPVEGVLLDIRMPVMDGMDVLPRLKDDHPNIPVIMMSATSDQELFTEAVRLGASGYIAKPIDAKDFDQLVRRAFSPMLI